MGFLRFIFPFLKKAPQKNVRATNKRIRKKQHILDVTIRQSVERARRTKALLVGICKLVLLCAFVGGAVYGGREGLRVYLWENPDYMLAEIAYHTDGTLTRDDVVRTSGLLEGVNIYKLDLSKARESVNGLPQVDRCEIQRLHPNRVTISINERKPIAWVTQRKDEDPTTSDKAYLIDARAIPMKPRAVLHQYMHLPVISGFAIENMADGQRVTDYNIQAALELVRLNTDNTRWQVTNIDVSSGYALVVTDNRRIQITFNLDRLDRQLDRLNRLFDVVGEKQKELQTVNLFGEKNTYATYVEATYEPEPEPAATPVPPPKPGAKPPVAVPVVKPVATPVPVVRSPLPISTTPKPGATPASRKASPSPSPVLRNPFRRNG